MSVVKSKGNKSMNTLKKAVLFSILGAIASGTVAYMGSSTTVMMDFCRCLLDGIITVFTYIVYDNISKGNIDKKYEHRWQKGIRFVTGGVMIITSILLALVSIMSFTPEVGEGNNLPSLVSTSICIFINIRIFLNYRKALKDNASHIIKAQCNMYRVKICVNAFVLLVIGIMIFAPTWGAIPYIDLVGTCVMSVFILTEGIKNIKNAEVSNWINRKTVMVARKVMVFVTSL